MANNGKVTYRLSLLGKPEIYADDVPVRVPRAKCKGIVFYLAAQKKDVSREKLQDVFWPELEQHTAQHNLNVHLSHIRKQLPGLIENDQVYFRLSADVIVDCQQFDAYFDAERFEFKKHREIINLYGGDFLEGLNISGSEEFDSWKSIMREHYLAVFIKGLLRLAEYHHKLGEYEEELVLLQNALRLDPLQESVYRSVMQLHYQKGDFLQVNTIYQKLNRVLNEEVGTGPMPETQDLYRMMLEHRSSTTSQIHSQRQRFALETGIPFNEIDGERHIFVGMQETLDRLRKNTLERTGSILRGIDGSGKTCLLRKVAGEWKGLVLWLDCRHATEASPFAPLVIALTAYFQSAEGVQSKRSITEKLTSKQREMIEAFIEDGALRMNVLSDDSNRNILFDTLAQVFLVIGARSPLLIIIDDLDLADHRMQHLMEHIVLHGRQMISFVGAISPLRFRKEDRAFAARFRERGLLERISMPGLTKEDVRQLLVESGYSKPEFAEWLWSMAGKNPYQLWELMRAMLGSVEAGKDSFTSEKGIIPLRIREYYETIALGLSDSARTVLETACVYGAVFPFNVIIRSEILTEVECLNGLDELLEKEVLFVGDDGQYSVFTPIIRETVYALISPSRRQWLHSRIAETLERDDDLVERRDRLGLMAHHFAKSLQPKRAVPYAIQAGDAAYKRSAWLDAVDYYEMARKYSDDSEFLLRYLSVAYLSAGETVEYYKLCEESSERARRYGEQEKYFVREIDVAFGEKCPIEEYRWCILPAIECPLDDREKNLLKRAEKVLENPVNDRYQYGRLCMSFAVRNFAAGDIRRAMDCVLEMLHKMENFSAEEQTMVIMGHMYVGVYLGELGKRKEALEYLRKGLSYAIEREVVFLEAIIRCEYGRQLALAENRSEAENQLKLSVKLSVEYRMVYIEARARFELGKLYLIEKRSEGERCLRDSLQLAESTNNSQHLQIHILEELIRISEQEELLNLKHKMKKVRQQFPIAGAGSEKD